MIVKPQLVRGSQANSAVRVGLLGCGGRGTADATSIAINGPARIVALADLFEDRLVTAKKHFDEVANEAASRRRAPPLRCFTARTPPSRFSTPPKWMPW